MSSGNVFWITGLSGAGKSTLGTLLYEKHKSNIKQLVLLDGDQLRYIIDNQDYSQTGRKKVAYQYSRFCKLLSDQGIDVIICTISMYEDLRQWNRDNIDRYCEVYVRVPIKELIRRDQKNLYSRALNGEISDVLGINADFEEPKKANIIIDNDGKKDINQIFEELDIKIQKWIKER